MSKIAPNQDEAQAQEARPSMRKQATKAAKTAAFDFASASARMVKFFGSVVLALQGAVLESVSKDWITPIYCFAFFYAWVCDVTLHQKYSMADLNGWYINARGALLIHYGVDSAVSLKTTQPGSPSPGTHSGTSTDTK